jgi:hypothetical protein
MQAGQLRRKAMEARASIYVPRSENKTTATTAQQKAAMQAATTWAGAAAACRLSSARSINELTAVG